MDGNFSFEALLENSKNKKEERMICYFLVY